MDAPFSALDAPERLGRYVLFHEVARGGMGTVYLARSRSRGGAPRIVALKRLHPDLAGDERFRRMFLDEVRIISRLNHPNTGSALDGGEELGLLWLTMPFVLGESLDRVIDALHAAEPTLRAQLPELTAQILRDACEGLHAAHELRGADDQLLEVVHRDVTPRNVIVGYDGVTRVIDFGIASALNRLHQTATGELKGTAGYAAPEHIQGKVVDRRADVWSLGVVGWELCLGHRLFGAKTPADILDQVLHAPIAGPSEASSSVPLGLDEVILKALNRDRNRRYETAREMGKDLSVFLSEHGKPIGAAQVAAAMEALFPGAHARKRKALEDVRARELPSRRSSRPKAKGQAAWWKLVLAAAAGAGIALAILRLS